MRVTSGSARGLWLESPVGWHTRPTSDKVKQALFNILADKTMACRFLDLYSGTGAIGIEALSRGAESSVFVENDSIALKVLEKNLAKTRLEGRALISRTAVSLAIRAFVKQGRRFDIIYADPPYDIDDLEALAKNSGEILDTDGIVIIETDAKRAFGDVSPLVIKDERKYGGTKLVFLRKE